jgi:hypothetical protein
MTGTAGADEHRRWLRRELTATVRRLADAPDNQIAYLRELGSRDSAEYLGLCTSRSTRSRTGQGQSCSNSVNRDDEMGEEVGAAVVLKEGESVEADESPRGPTGKILKREIEVPEKVESV